MNLKYLYAVITICLILVAAVIIFTVNSEENKNTQTSDVNKFIGTWQLLSTQIGGVDNQNPDTTAFSEKFVDYERYTFLSNGTFYHLVDQDNTSGTWAIHDSVLGLTMNQPTGVVTYSFAYTFSDDINRVSLNFFEDATSYWDFQRLNTG
jgi:hypothetical protein